jgi:hypothetical protein
MKWLNEIHNLVWTAVGTGLVLITLSGRTRSLGIWITGVGLTIHIIGVVLSQKDDSAD